MPKTRLNKYSKKRKQSFREVKDKTHDARSQLANTPMGYYNGVMISNIKKRALHRSKIIEGQMRGVQKMIENEEYCMDILTQSLAIQKSIGSLNKLLIENHLKTHIAQKVKSDSDTKQNEIIDELLKIYEISNIRSR